VKNQITKALSVLLVTTSLVACTADGQVDTGTMSTAIGGVAGGVLGSQFGEGSGKTAMAIGGALLGAWAGNKVGQSLTAQDQGYYSTAAQQAAAAPVGQTVTWYNPNSGTQGTITPTRVGTAADGSACREYQQTITVGGKTERAYGVACMQPDGTWRIVN